MAPSTGQKGTVMRTPPSIHSSPLVAALVMLTMLLVPLPARGDANPPLRSGTGVAKLALVTAYAPCTVPDVESNGEPACSPVRRDTVCGFGSGGLGLLKIRRYNNLNPNMVSAIKLVGLDAGCEGEELCIELVLRTTQAPDFICSGAGGCTLPDPAPMGGCCTVTDGRCIKPLATAHLHAGLAIEAELLQCGVTRTTGPSQPAGNTFACGFFVDVD
jgi:hypothetical protein